MTRPIIVASLLFLTMSATSQVTPRLKTPWTDKVSRTKPHQEYPRPQFVRKHWVNLNGQWDFALTPTTEQGSVTYDRRILVPFPVESALSGLALHVPDGSQLWYRRNFDRPVGDRILLHFGASDFETTAWVNGQEVGTHKGGYDPFTFDITEALSTKPLQELTVCVTDPTDEGTQPRGKQVRNPEGIWYTSTSGIWQTVWLEPVPKTSIDKVVLRPDPGNGKLQVDFSLRGQEPDLKYVVQVLDGKEVVADEPGSSDPRFSLRIPSPKLWSPESPFLYDVRLSLINGSGKTIDSVESYAAFRSVRIGPDAKGITRIFLNEKPTLMLGPLDQGFWPDGLYTPPTDEAMKYDIEVTKRVGFNMIRKHVKVEPDRWYYWCDKLGMLVWQDMPSGDRYIGPNDPDIQRTPESAQEYDKELLAMIDAFRNHPSIVTWVPFNEGWGQYDVARVTDMIRAYDPTRLIDSTTGWADRGVGDMIDWHIYPGPGCPEPEPNRAAVLGEFGGLGLPVPGHMWEEKNWGYQSYKTHEELTHATVELFHKLRALIDKPGLSAAVYTQTTDVETEANGLMTYDRRVFKMNEKQLREAIQAILAHPMQLSNASSITPK